MTINIGMIGTGLMAGIYGKILRQRPDCRLSAVVGNSADKTARFANDFGIAGYGQGRYEEMLERHPDIDAVIITTPEWVREEPVAAAIRHKKHILLEKPFAASLKDALALDKLLAGYGKVFDICHVLRYSPRFYALQQSVARGDVGDIRHIYARLNSNNARVRRVLGKTNLAFWLAPHHVDITRWITGADVQEVFARSRGGMKTDDDYIIANLRMSNGVDAVLEISWCNPPISGTAREASFEVWGNKGYVDVHDSDMNIRFFGAENRVAVADTYEDYEVHGLHYGMFKNLIDHFVGRVMDGKPDTRPLRDAVESIRACDMIARSIATQRVVGRE